jgi:hypothetical protein
MLARVGGLPLCDLFFAKMRQVIAATGCRVIVPIHHGDRELVQRAKSFDIDAPDRSERSRDGEIMEDIWDGMAAHVQDDDVILVLNPCMPFWPVLEMLEAYAVAAKTTHATVAVFQQQNWLWDANRKMLVGGGTPNSKTDPVYYSIARTWISYRAECIGKPDMMEYDQFHVIEPTFNHWDIDTPEQLQVAQIYAEGSMVHGRLR